MFEPFLRDKSYWLLSLWMFFLPVYSCMWDNKPSVVLLLSVIIFMCIEGHYRNKNFSWITFLVLCFYLISIIGVFYTLHPYKGIELINQQVSLLLMGVVVYIRRFTLCELRHFAFLILGGTVSVGTFLLIKSVLIASSSGDLMQLFYVSFAPTTRFYPTFLSLFTSLSFVIVFVSFERFKSLFKGKNAILLALLLYLGLITFCLDSKAGTLAMFVIVGYFSLWYMLKDFKMSKLLLIPALAFMCFQIFVSSPRNLMMVDSFAQDKGAETSTSQRVMFIKAAFKTIPQTLPFGEGSYGKKATPTFSKSLEEFVPVQQTHDELPAAIRRSNSHNQFLDSTMQHGLLGIAVLSILFLYPFMHSIKCKDYLVPVLLLVTAFYFGVEGIILKSYGVRYFVVIWLVFFVPVLSRRNMPLKDMLNINSSFEHVESTVNAKEKWSPLHLSLWLLLALLLMAFIVTNDIIINYNAWGELAIRESRRTYVPWFAFTLSVYLIRTIWGVFRREVNKKWVLYVILLLFQPVMILFYM